MSTKTMLKTEIQNEFKELTKLQVGSDEYKIAIDGINKLIDRALELDKFDADREDKDIDREFDQRFKLEMAKDEKRDRRIKNYLTAAGIAIPTGVTIWGVLKSLKFEETGSVTTLVGKTFIGKLFRK